MRSADAKYAGQPVAVEAPRANAGAAGDLGLVLSHAARHYALTAPLAQPVDLSDDRPLVLQYEARFQEGLTCGGAYLKLYTAAPGDVFDPAAVTGATPYTVMFGPDRCGATDKVHLIVRYAPPAGGPAEEKHLTGAPHPPRDTLSHLYTLVLRPDGSFSVRVDGVSVRDGNLSDAFEPPFLPPATIPDPTDAKPADWVEEARIADPAAAKPADWDEDAPMTLPDEDATMPAGWLEGTPATLADPAAAKPPDWDDEEDGSWEAPQVDNPACEHAPGCGPWVRPSKRNPAYRGPWRAPLVDNPAYRGPWAPRAIPNPAAFTDPALWRLGGPGAAMGAVGLEVWTMSGGLLFDNVLLARDEATASDFAAATFRVKAAAEAAGAAAAARDAARADRRAKAVGGTLLDAAAFYAGELADAAQRLVPDARVAVALAACGALALLAGCYAACCRGGGGGGGKAAHSHAHHSHAHGSGGGEAAGEADAAHGGEGPVLAPPPPPEAVAAAAATPDEAAAEEEDGDAPASKGGVRRRATRRKA